MLQGLLTVFIEELFCVYDLKVVDCDIVSIKTRCEKARTLFEHQGSTNNNRLKKNNKTG